MPPRKKEPSGPTPVEAFRHEDKRVNIPTADSSELVSPDVAQPTQLRYPRNPDLDPQLVWRGKDEQDGEDLVVDAPPIYIQEKIVPQVIIENLRKVVEKPAAVAVRGVRRARGVRGRRVLPARGQLVQPDDPGRLAPGDGVPRGKGEPAGEGADGVPGPALRDQVRFELAGANR